MSDRPVIQWSENGRCWCVVWPNGAVVGNYPTLLEAEAAAAEAEQAE